MVDPVSVRDAMEETVGVIIGISASDVASGERRTISVDCLGKVGLLLLLSHWAHLDEELDTATLLDVLATVRPFDAGKGVTDKEVLPGINTDNAMSLKEVLAPV